MTVSEPDDKGKTAPIQQPTPAIPPHGQPQAVSPPESRVEPLSESESQNIRTPPGPHVTAERQSESESQSVRTAIGAHDPVEPLAVVAQPASPQEREVVFVPMSVSIGDGFKFGCGFFLALVLAMLVGFVLLAALFVLTSLFGLNLPITR